MKDEIKNDPDASGQGGSGKTDGGLKISRHVDGHMSR